MLFPYLAEIKPATPFTKMYIGFNLCLFWCTISDSFVRNAPATENFGGEDEGSGNIVGNVINDAICETSYAVDYKNIALSDKWLTFVDNAPALKVFAGDTPVITQKVTPVLDKGVVSWEAQSQAAYYLWLCHNKWLIFDEK